MDYLCPHCRSKLEAVRQAELDTWECSAGHGVGITLSESYGHFQEDEIDAIWKAARTAPQSSLKSPGLGNPMVAITVMVDDDEVVGNEGPGARAVTLDVAPQEQFLWFEVVDFNDMPADLPNPPPSEEEIAHLEKLGRQSHESIARDLNSREGAISKLGYRIGSKAAALLNLEGVTRRLGDSARSRMDG